MEHILSNDNQVVLGEQKYYIISASSYIQNKFKYFILQSITKEGIHIGREGGSLI